MSLSPENEVSLEEINLFLIAIGSMSTSKKSCQLNIEATSIKYHVSLFLGFKFFSSSTLGPLRIKNGSFIAISRWKSPKETTT